MYSNKEKRNIPMHYKDPEGGWEFCRVLWANGELSYYSPLLPNAYPIPPIPFRLASGSNLYWENYMLDTGIRHIDAIKELIKEYNFDTVKYAKYQVIPSTDSNIERLERLLADQDRMYYEELKKEIESAFPGRFQVMPQYPHYVNFRSPS